MSKEKEIVIIEKTWVEINNFFGDKRKYLCQLEVVEYIENQQQEIEQLKKENEGLHKEKAFYSEQWENVCKENEELIKFNKNVKGVLESIGKPHLGLALSSMLDKANELLTKKG